MPLTKAELADLLFEKVGLTSARPRTWSKPSSRRFAARSSAAKA